MARKHPNADSYEGSLKDRSAPEEIAEIESYMGTRLPKDIRYFIERFDGLEAGSAFRSIRWLSRREMLENSRETALIHSSYVEAPQLLPGAWYSLPFDNGGGGLGVDAFISGTMMVVSLRVAVSVLLARSTAPGQVLIVSPLKRAAPQASISRSCVSTGC